MSYSDKFVRTRLMLGDEAMKKLSEARVAVFGVGGVGGYVVEALVRSGVGSITVYDDDVVNESNLNRQIIATVDTIGRPKVEVIKERALSINPDMEFNACQMIYDKETAENIDFTRFDYIVDAIDTVTSKIIMIEKAVSCGTPIISSMGTGKKLDPTKFEITDIYKTSVCPLARVMRYELKKRGIKKLKVLYSKEEPVKLFEDGSSVEDNSLHGKRQTVGSVAFVPSAAGLIIGGEVIKDIIV